MTWSWILIPDPGADAPAQEAFTNQGDAESWIGLHWRALSEAGVMSVALVDDGTTIYEMSLASADE